MSISTRSFGKTANGEEVTCYSISNANGLRVEVIDYGANIVSLYTPDKNGNFDDIVLGFDDVKGYEFNPSFFGSFIGRSANRIANAEFVLGDKVYRLARNDGKNNLHSEFDTCFNKKMFKAEILEDENAVKFTVFSPNMDQGFPGNLTASVIYRLTEQNALELEYDADTDEDTIYNPTNHSYFNLNGHASGSAMSHVLRLNATHYTPTVPGSIPTGEIASVAGTPFDFTTAQTIGDRIDLNDEQLNMAGGYDHNFVPDTTGTKCEQIAILSSEESGRRMSVYSDLPGVQFYAGNFIAVQKGKGGVTYGKRHGVCLETQYFPNAINQIDFKKPVLKAGNHFHSITKYVF